MLQHCDQSAAWRSLFGRDRCQGQLLHPSKQTCWRRPARSLISSYAADQAIFCRRRRPSMTSPLQAARRPGRPAPTTGAGTLASIKPVKPVGPLKISAGKSWPSALVVNLVISNPAPSVIVKLSVVILRQLFAPFPCPPLHSSPYPKSPVPSKWRTCAPVGLGPTGAQPELTAEYV